MSFKIEVTNTMIFNGTTWFYVKLYYNDELLLGCNLYKYEYLEVMNLMENPFKYLKVSKGLSDLAKAIIKKL